MTAEGSPPRPSRARALAWVVLPLLVLALHGAPSIDYLLPGFESHLGENYQPLRALKFYSSLGGAYHKYGPMPNWVLLPVYGPSLAVWWATGSFAGPSGDFPYGLRDALGQLSFLIRAGRIEFMVLGLGLYAFLLLSLRFVTPRPAAAAAAFLACVGTSYTAAHFLANTRPDGLSYAFLAASLGVYVRILDRGATPARVVWLSLLAVFAISSKELAGPAYLLPYLGLGLRLHRQAATGPVGRARFRRLVGASLASGVGAYLLLNVVYDPAVWARRMSHWLGGTGTSADVWRAGGAAALTPGVRAVEAFEGFLDTLGPGGLWLVPVALAALVCLGRRHRTLLLLPFASLTLFGLVPLGFPGDRFYTMATVTLVPPVASGLDALCARARTGPARASLWGFAILALGANAWFASWAWLELEGRPERTIERALASEDPPFDGSLNVLSVYPRVPGKSRLEVAGQRLDPRSIQELLDAAPASLPDRIYASEGTLRFLEDARGAPARAELFASQGLEFPRWRGVEALGYRLRETVRTPTPAWFPFDWMPAVRWRAERSPMRVYERILP